MTRLGRTLIVVGIALLLVEARAQQPPMHSREGAPRPNILIIWSDDQAARTLGCEGNRFIETPNIDALAAAGVRFSRHYVPVPVCGPSRAAFISGRYPFDVDMMSNREGDFDFSTPTFAEALRSVGYRCGLIGKWHVGPPNEPVCGFDDAWEALDLESAASTAREKSFDPVLWIGGRRVAFNGYGTSVLADRAIEFLRQSAVERSRPFLLWLAFRSPHFPYYSPPGRWLQYDPSKIPLPESAADDLSGKPAFQKADPPHATFQRQGASKVREGIATYYAMMSALDADVGRVMDALDELGLSDDTLVIYSSDNGWLLGEHQMHGKCAAFYEELVRMPLILRWPCGLPAGRTVDALVSSMDIFPTLVDVAGAPRPPRLDGVDLLPLARGEVASVRDEMCLSFHRKEGQMEQRPMLGVVTPRHKYARYLEGDLEELYDLDADPFEMHNLANAAAKSSDAVHDALAALRQRVDVFKSSIQRPFWNLPERPSRPNQP